MPIRYRIEPVKLLDTLAVARNNYELSMSRGVSTTGQVVATEDEEGGGRYRIGS
jgi:hypothetical protein